LGRAVTLRPDSHGESKFICTIFWCDI